MPQLEGETVEEFYARLAEMSVIRPGENEINPIQARYYIEATPKGATAKWWIENRNGLHHALGSSRKIRDEQ